jgi:hypothetical protein
MAENTVGRFVVREKHCWLAEKARLIRQASRAQAVLFLLASSIFLS